jgi:hypothetical protein
VLWDAHLVSSSSSSSSSSTTTTTTTSDTGSSVEALTYGSTNTKTNANTPKMKNDTKEYQEEYNEDNKPHESLDAGLAERIRRVLEETSKDYEMGEKGCNETIAENSGGTTREEVGERLVELIRLVDPGNTFLFFFMCIY